MSSHAVADVRVDFYYKGSLVAFAEVEDLDADTPMVALTVQDEGSVALVEPCFDALRHAMEVTAGMARVYALSHAAMEQAKKERETDPKDDLPF